MANNARLFKFLTNGARDSAGAVLASGLARFYEPGTLTPITVYSDAAATVSVSQPVTLSAAGKATVYTLVPCRVIIKDSTDTTTVYDLNYANTTRAELLLITNTNVNGGAETDLDTHLSNVADSNLGYLEGSAATTRSRDSWMRETHVKVTDYNAAGNGSSDDLAEIQAAIDRAVAADRTSATKAKTVVVEIPEGTWDISGALAVTVAAGNTPFVLRGQGPKKTIINLTGTTQNGLTLNWSVGATDARVILEDFAIAAENLSSGTGISITNANNTILRNVQISGFRTSFDSSGATGTQYDKCTVASTDTNSAAIGIKPGNNDAIVDCVLSNASSNGTAVSGTGTGVQIRNLRAATWTTGISNSGVDTEINGGNITAGTTGVSLAGARSQAFGVTLAGTPTTGFSLGAAGTAVIASRVTGGTTGISIGAFADCRVIGNYNTGPSTALSVNASATNQVVFGNSDQTSRPTEIGAKRVRAKVTSTAGAPTTSITPTVDGGAYNITRYKANTGTIGGTVTFNNTATTGLVDGDILVLHLVNDISGASVNVAQAWGTQYVESAGDAMTSHNITQYNATTWFFYWDAGATEWVLWMKDKNFDGT